MPVNTQTYLALKEELDNRNVLLVAVSKTKSIAEINELYELGQRDFGENYSRELIEKHAQLPTDIRWHFIGHLQSNKVKDIVHFVQLIQGVDSLKLLSEINKQAGKTGRKSEVLLQIHIAREETKFGLDEKEFHQVMQSPELGKMEHVRIAGLMGMASFTDDKSMIESEFRFLKSLYDKYPGFSVLSMGMTADYKIAIENGSTMVRIGSLLFGDRG